MSKSAETAQSFLEACREHGLTPVVKNAAVVAVTASFTPGDKDAFTGFDMMAGSVLDILGARGGSQWGTDGGSVGGAVALQKGRFTLNQSGVPKRVVNALRKAAAA